MEPIHEVDSELKQKKSQEQFITGKQCRDILHKKVPPRPRVVHAFTFEALLKNTIVEPPPKINVFAKRFQKHTMFAFLFGRGDIPCVLSGQVVHPLKIDSIPVEWFCKPENLDYCHYLPIIMDGLADQNPEFRTLARFASMDMIVRGPEKVLPVIPKCVPPLKRALETRDKRVISVTLRVIQIMVVIVPCAGPALVPFYRQLLPICNLFKSINVNLKCGIDTNSHQRVGDVIEDTLRILEQCGGPLAYINIKYMVPTYESHVQPKCASMAHFRPCPQKKTMDKVFDQIGTRPPPSDALSVTTVPSTTTAKSGETGKSGTSLIPPSPEQQLVDRINIVRTAVRTTGWSMAPNMPHADKEKNVQFDKD